MEETIKQLLVTHIENNSALAVGVAFLGGVLSSISPCALSILPILVGYIAGCAEDDDVFKAFFHSVLFVIGLTIVLTIIGLVAALAGSVIGSFVGPAWYVVLGSLSIFMGLSLLELFHIHFPVLIKDMPQDKYGSVLYPIILGMAFGTIASPCSTPILVTLVSYVAYKGSLVFGTLMLMAYAFGHGILMIIAGTFTGEINHILKIRHWSQYTTKFSGILLILIGIYLIYVGFRPLA